MPNPDWFQAHFRSDITPEHIRQVPSAAEIEKSKADWMNVQRFHYVKLHGSCNWVSATNSHRMVLGRAKEKQILEEPLSRWYFELFRSTLTVTGSRLLVVGYGFRDAHVNAAIADAGDLRVFVMSPQPPEQFRSELRHQPNGDRIWDRIDDYYETSLAQLFPADQSITEMWDRVQMAFFERRLKWQDP